MKSNSLLDKGKLSLLLFFIFAGTLCLKAVDFSNETLDYIVSYKWGLVNKDAAKAQLKIKNSGNDYQFILTAKSLPWVDKFFIVRDTLTSTVDKRNFRVKSYVKSTNEGGRYGRDNIQFTYAGSVVQGKVKRYRRDKDGSESNADMTLTSSGPTFDMLSVFYYLRRFPFTGLKKDHVYKCR